MKETIRCWLSCILPCGALDAIRIVHANGHVEELRGRTPILASQVMRAHPKHALRTPAVTLPPSAQLKRGRIYLLVPLSNRSPAKQVPTPPLPQRKKPGKRPALWRPALDTISELSLDI